MKKLITLTLLLLTVVIAYSQNKVKIQNGENTTLITDLNPTGFRFSSSLGNIYVSNIKTKDGDYLKISIPNYYPDNKIGFPELPVYSRIIEIPDYSDVKINIISYDEQRINLNELGYEFKIIPNQPSIFKNQDPNSVKFEKNEAIYKNHEFYETELIQIKTGSKIRGVQTGFILISPFSYDIETNTLIIRNNIIAEISFKDAQIAKYNKIKSEKYSPHFEQIYKMIWNYNPPSNKDALSKYPIKYVIVSHRMFESTLQPFIEWKIKKGFNVIVGYTDEIGSSAANIKTFVQNLYNSGTESDPAPTYLLLVGDVAQCATNVLSQHVSDMYFGEFDGGGDYIPEMYIGRFSATTTTQLETIIQKTLMFEQYTFPDPSFLQEAVLVAGDDATYGPTHANGQINYAKNYYFNSANQIIDHTYLYPASSSSAAQIKSDISNGVGFVNYTAHCGSNGWAGPSFTTSDIPALQNQNEYFFSIGNCCLSNKFNDPECFGEALIRTSNKGAVVHIGGSNNTLWNEDFYWSVGIASNINANPTYEGTTQAAYDHLFHFNGEDEYSSAAQINYIGNMAVYQSTSSQKQYYWEIYHVMGDPSLMPYIGIPAPVAANYLNSLTIGMSSLTVNTEPNAYVAISIDGNLLDAKLANNSGVAELEFETLSSVGVADIVITKQFRAPHISTINIIPNDNDYDVMMQSILSPESIIHISNSTIIPSIKILNLGQQNLNSVVVGYTLNGSNPVELNWNGDLAFLESEIINFPEITLPEGTNIFYAYASSPNGQTDEYPQNNSLTKNVLVYSGNVKIISANTPSEIICNTNTFQPKITIKNFDSYPLTSATLHYTCNNVEDTYVWNGNLMTNQTTEITFPSNTFPAGNNTITYQIISVNNGTNVATSGQSLDVNFTVIESGVLIRLNILTDYYPDETTWQITDANQQVIYSGGPFQNRNTNYTYDLCMNFGCYTFTVFDSYGDGMNGSAWFNPAKGRITITNLLTQEIIWDWTSSQNWSSYSFNFCLGQTSLEKINEGKLTVFPNPNNGQIYINAPEKILNIEIFSTGGQQLKSFNNCDNNCSLNIEEFSSGIYILKIHTYENIFYHKIIKN